jgi:hypothetical protein
MNVCFVLCRYLPDGFKSISECSNFSKDKFVSMDSFLSASESLEEKEAAGQSKAQMEGCKIEAYTELSLDMISSFNWTVPSFYFEVQIAYDQVKM